MDRFEILDENLRKLDLSPQEVIKYWLNNNRIYRSFLHQILTSKTTYAEENIFQHLQIGWYFFAEGNFSPYPDSFPNPIGVVAWLKPDIDAKEGERGLIILFDEFYGMWSDNMIQLVGCDSPSDGAENTRKLINAQKETKIKFPIAEFCEQKNSSSCQCFIPAYKQLDKIANSYSILNGAFKKVGKKMHSVLFSSTEIDVNKVLCMDMHTGKLLHLLKASPAHSHLVISF